MTKNRVESANGPATAALALKERYDALMKAQESEIAEVRRLHGIVAQAQSEIAKHAEAMQVRRGRMAELALLLKE